MSETITIPKSEYLKLLADKARLDFLDASHHALNHHSGNVSYGWKFVLSTNVRRLMAGSSLVHNAVDLNDAKSITPADGGCSSVRVAIDRAAAEFGVGNDVSDDALVATRLDQWSREWIFCGGSVHCRGCGSGVPWVIRKEPLVHEPGCKTYYAYPWAELENLLSVPSPLIEP